MCDRETPTTTRESRTSMPSTRRPGSRDRTADPRHSSFMAFKDFRRGRYSSDTTYVLCEPPQRSARNSSIMHRMYHWLHQPRHFQDLLFGAHQCCQRYMHVMTTISMWAAHLRRPDCKQRCPHALETNSISRLRSHPLSVLKKACEDR